jgi:hypothetical protein
MLRDTYFLPVVERLFVIKEDSYPQALRCKPQPLGNKFPGPVNCLLLEVITNAKVAQHLKKSKVASVTYQLNIRGTKTLLT